MNASIFKGQSFALNVDRDTVLMIITCVIAFHQQGAVRTHQMELPETNNKKNKGIVQSNKTSILNAQMVHCPCY